jgi:hypothetical protein
VQVRRERLEHPTQRAPLDPGLKATMTGLIRRIAVGKILPGCARAENPKDSVQHVARIPPRSAALVAAHTGRRQEWREDRPLRVSEVHAVEYDGDRNFVHTPCWGL